MCAMGREVVKEKKGFQRRVGGNLERWGAHGQGGQGAFTETGLGVPVRQRVVSVSK